jgi:hypothetical protein
MPDLTGQNKEKITNVLAPRGYEVEIPPYQRRFVWDRKKVRQLFRDLCGSPRWFADWNEDTPQGEPYFMGVMVIAKPPSKMKWTVVDGQQRLTTFALVLRALEVEYARKGLEPPDELGSSLRTTTRQGKRPILRLQGPDAEAYAKLITCDDDAVDLVLKEHKSDPIVSTYATCRKEVRIQIRRAIETGVEREVALSALYERFARDPFVVVLTTDAESYGFALFETLNGKGEPLTASELTKNKLLGALSTDASGANGAIERWKEIERTLVRKRTIENFLATYWTSSEGYVSKGHLYQAICESLDSQNGEGRGGRVEKAAKLLRELTATSRLYALMVDPDLGSSGGSKIGVSSRNRLHRLNYVGAESLRPLLLAVLACLPEQVEALIELLECISIRQSIARGRFNTLFDIYCEIAIEVWQSKKDEAEYDVVDNLLDALEHAGIQFADSEFESGLATATFRDAGKAPRAVLLAINSKRQGDEIRYHSPRENNLEHILPKNFNADVSAESGVKSKDLYGMLVGRIGNLTIWAEADNKASQDDSFSRKRPFYDRSALAITKELATLNRFTEAEVGQRSRDLAREAVEALPWKWKAPGKRTRRSNKDGLRTGLRRKAADPVALDGSATMGSRTPKRRGKKGVGGSTRGSKPRGHK